MSKKRTNIGGQAVIEGVMMRGKTMYAMAVRNKERDIDMKKEKLSSFSDKVKLFKLPIFRGILAFVESLTLGLKIITASAEMAGIEEEGEPSKFEKFLVNKFGDKLNNYIMGFSVSLSIVFAILLFILLPVWIASLVKILMPVSLTALSVLEGLIRIAIFLFYIVIISKLKDIQRVFQYHGAEHKTINCFECGDPLTVENVKKQTRIHKRCGTSFLVLVMIISMIVFMFLRTDDVTLRILSRLLLIPFVAGLSYEAIRWAGKSESTLVSVISYPGMCLQHLTTREPDNDQIEVAIAAMSAVLEEEPE